MSEQGQPMEALALATSVRSLRAELKRQLRRREVTLDMAMDRPWVQTMKVESLLLAVPGIGKARVRKWFKALGISHLASVQDLSESRRRQLEELVG